MNTYPPSQNDVIEAFVKWLNADRRATYQKKSRPDQIARNRPDIDYIIRDPEKNHEIAVEVSSVWRSKQAGMEDAYFEEWFNTVRQNVRGQIVGSFHVSMPVRVPRGMVPSEFAISLVKAIKKSGVKIATASEDGENIAEEVGGISVRLFKSSDDGSNVEYARMAPSLEDFPEHVRRCLDEKAPKLRAYSDKGIETWIVIYNTVWPLLSRHDVKEIIEAQFGSEHEHVTHIGICAGNPPNDAWIIAAR